MITIDQLSAIVSEGESEVLEFKQTTGQRTEAAKTVCAMLNTRGGRVLFGVDRVGTIVGQSVTDKTVEDVVNEIRLIDPPALPSIDRIAVSPRFQAIMITTQRGSRRPYVYKNTAFRRVGNSNLPLSREEYNRLLLEELHATSRWENQQAEGWTVRDLDSGEIVRTLDESIRRGRMEDPGTRNPVDILRGLGLLREEQLLRSAVVLFAKPERLLPDYPQCLLRVARFRGVDKTEFLDNRQFRGGVFDLLTRSERFLRENLPVAGRIVPNLFERIDDPLYPPLALREALANAFCHRDYGLGGGSVAIAIFDNRLEISSSGPLHFGITVQSLYQEHDSQPWNPLIANTLYRRGVIETWGRGTLKIAELTEQAGLPRPEIEEIAGSVVVRFWPSEYLAPQRIRHDLTTRQQIVLRELGKHGPVALRELTELLGEMITQRALRDELAFLKRLELVESTGYGRGARWFVVSQIGH